MVGYIYIFLLILYSRNSAFMLLNFQVAKFNDPRDACAAIVAESYRLWLQYETRTDDITVIVVHINGLTDVGASLSLSLLSLICFIL